MNIFGWKSAGRERPRPVLSARESRYGSGAGIGTVPRSYEAQVREGYLGNAIAQRSVRLVAEGVGDAPLSGAPELLALVQARSGGQTLTATLAAQLLLHGNAYAQLLCDADGRLVELFALRPERVSIEPDALGWPAAYRYKVGERTLRLAVLFEAGMGEDWAALPAPLRQGAALLAAHLFDARDAAMPPPAAVTALWRPFRRLAIGGAVSPC